MESSIVKENLVKKIQAFETYMYSDRKSFESAIVDYEESFGRPDFLYSEKLAKDDGFIHTLLQFADAMGFIHGDTLSDISRIETYNPVLSPENEVQIAKYKEFNKLELDVIRAVAEYRTMHPEKIGRGE